MCQIDFAGSGDIPARGPTNLWRGNLFRTVIAADLGSREHASRSHEAIHRLMEEENGRRWFVTASVSDRLALPLVVGGEQARLPPSRRVVQDYDHQAERGRVCPLRGGDRHPNRPPPP